jgi:AraC-like DNA-binding protein
MSAKYTFLAWDTPVKNSGVKVALLQLANNADDDGFSYYSISKMAIACGMSDRNFMRQIAELEKMNVLKVERRSNRPSLYTLEGDEMGVTLCHLQSVEVTESHGEVTESHLVGDSVSHDPNTTPNTTPESIINTAFEHFWLNMKLSKKSKQAAQKIFYKLTKSNQDPMFFANELIRDTNLRFRNKQFGFDKLHPSTYLNCQRWEDEYTIDKPQSKEVVQMSGGGDWAQYAKETF